MKRGLNLALWLAACLAQPLLAQNPGDSLKLWVDYASFGSVSGETKARVEFYYALSQEDLVSPGSESLAFLDLDLKLYSASDSLVENNSWRVAYRPSLLVFGEAEQILSDIYQTALPAGEYRLNLTCRDEKSKMTGRQELSFLVPDYSTTNLFLSDLQLALEVSPAQAEGRFDKGSIYVLPNPTTVYGVLSPLLYFYAEVYNLKTGDEDSLFNASYEILDSAGGLVKSYGTYVKTKPGTSAVVATGLNIASLPMGRYLLRLSVSDPGQNQAVEREKPFFIYREEEAPLVQDSDSLFFARLPGEEDVYKKIRQVLVSLTTPDNLRIYDALSPEGKKNFLDDFWRSRDPLPSTSANEYKDDIFRRLAYASQEFKSVKSGKEPGWKSDRGRTLLKYGFPDEVQDHPYRTDQKPWQQWVYRNIQRGVVFVFEDTDGYGNFQLVHSTAQGEKHNPTWQLILEDELHRPEN